MGGGCIGLLVQQGKSREESFLGKGPVPGLEGHRQAEPHGCQQNYVLAEQQGAWPCIQQGSD